MNKQQIEGNLRTPESRRKAKNRQKGKVSKHTMRFRATTVLHPMRSLASVGGATRRKMAKRATVDTSRLAATALLPGWMQNGLAAFAKLAQAFTARNESAKAARKAAA
jgi:hypothetical protein